MEDETSNRIQFITRGGRTPLCTVDGAWNIRRCNDEFVFWCRGTRSGGVTPGTTLDEMLPPAVWEPLLETLTQAFRGEMTYAIFRDYRPSPADDPQVFELFFVLSDDGNDADSGSASGHGEEGQVLHIALRNITETYTAQQRMVQLAGRYQAVLESAVDLNSSIQELESVYRTTLEKLAGAIDFETGTIQILENDVLRVVAHHGFKSPGVLDTLRFPLDPRFPNVTVVRGRRPLALTDIRHDFPHFLIEKDQFGSGHIRSWMGVPIIDRGEVWGMVTLDRSEVRPFDGEDIELATAIANHAGVAISNARLYAKLQQSLMEQERLAVELGRRGGDEG